MKSSKVLPGAEKKRPPNAGRGRKKGVPNKVTKALKEMVLAALEKAGGEAYLVKQAKQKNPAAFMQLLGKVLPLSVQGLDKDGNPAGPPIISVTVGQIAVDPAQAKK